MAAGKLVACLLLVLALSASAQPLPVLPDFTLTSRTTPPGQEAAAPELDAALLATPPPPSPGSSPAQAPGPGSAAAGQCALATLLNAGTFQTLIDLVEGSSEADLLMQILGSSEVAETLLAPTDAGIAATLQGLNLTAERLLADPLYVTEVLAYHLLPSNLKASDLKDGYSFNTELSSGGIAQSVAVRGSGATATLVGRRSTAKLTGEMQMSCKFTIITIDGLLIP